MLVALFVFRAYNYKCRHFCLLFAGVIVVSFSSLSSPFLSTSYLPNTQAEWPDIFCVNLHLTQAKSPYPNVAAALAQIQGHGKHMWQNHETIAMLEWIKKFNASQEYRPDSVVYVFGVDCQQIYRSLNVLYIALAEVDFALCQELKARLSFFNGHSEDEHEYAKKTVRGIGSENIPEILQGILSEFQWKHFDRLKAKLPKEKLLDILNIEQNIEVLVNPEE